jgi:hypothetical protein
MERHFSDRTGFSRFPLALLIVSAQEIMNRKQNAGMSDGPPPQVRPGGALVKMLLRHYAKNLRRSWRNTPHAAFLDATIQVEAPLVVALMCPLSLLNLVLSRTIFPSLANHLGQSKYSYGILATLALVLITIWTLDRKLKPYEFTPSVEADYGTGRDRLIVNLYFAGAFVLLGAGLLGAYYLNKIFPAP